MSSQKYEKVSSESGGEYENDSESGTVTPLPPVPASSSSGTTRSRLWAVGRYILGATFLLCWIVSMDISWNTTRQLMDHPRGAQEHYRTTHELMNQMLKMRSQLDDLKMDHKHLDEWAHAKHPPQALVPARVPVTEAPGGHKFIEGGVVDLPGYKLVYNASYCNGRQDPEGAKSRGCVFDKSMGGWVHEVCTDTEQRLEWDELPDFGWFLDEAATQQVPQSHVWSGDDEFRGVDLYTTAEYHFRHCVAMMNIRLKHQFQKDKGLTAMALNGPHTIHCIDRLLAWVEPGEKKEMTLVRGTSEGEDGSFGSAMECYMQTS